MEPDNYLNLAGNCASVAICLYMLNYFMKRDEVREKDMREIILNNTRVVEQTSKAVEHNTEIITELKSSITDKIALFQELKEQMQKQRSANGQR